MPLVETSLREWVTLENFFQEINSLPAYYKSERCLKVKNEINLMEMGHHYDVQKRPNV